MTYPSIAGIDYGARKAGTTAIYWYADDTFHVRQSEKKTDADAFLLNAVKEINPSHIFIDAPLSLPGVYTSSGFSDYHYRECDRQVKAMSPMFLGGLTARAMDLKNQLASFGIEVTEVYPSRLVEQFDIRMHYKKELRAFRISLEASSGINNLAEFSSWHQVDSCLAWISGLRYYRGNSVIFGNPEEGLIYI